jgi:ERCC4-related helicase
MYRTYLSRFKICGLSSEIQVSQKVPMSSLIEKYDIIVMTPQILLNALNKHHVESLKVFTLMVFDECHHATKEHPYNNIMAVYLDEKYLEIEIISCHR